MIWPAPFILLLTSLIINRSNSHVVLTFPPARYPPLDFLDSTITNGPCGVPKSQFPRYTTLVAGDKYNITWRMNYETEGGFKIAVLDQFGAEVKRLTPSDDRFSKFIGRHTPLKHHFMVALPERFTCYGCSIQLEREVKDWGNYKRFLSCADVNIVKRFDDLSPFRLTQMDTGPTINNCLNHGTITAAGECLCDKLYSGDMCQYKDDCWFDEDCGNGSTCVDTASEDYPRLVCYCTPSRFGRNCEYEFKPSVLDVAFPCFNYQYKRDQKWLQRALQNANAKTSQNVKYDLFDASCYDKKTMNDEQDSIYWRKIGDELEVVLEVTGQTWIGLGWRPIGLSTDCKKFPIDIEEDIVPKTIRKKRGGFDPQVAIPQILLLTLREFVRPFVNGSNFSGNSSNIEAVFKKWLPSNESTNSSVAAFVSQQLFNLQSSGSMPSLLQKTESVLHPMDCTDIVMGSAIGDQSRFADMYTRDRSTPMSDEIYYGEYSLTAAYGFEFNNGKTVLMFRKHVKAADVADHPLGPGFMHVIFAKGKRLPNSKVQSFADVVYKPKKLMYHGHINRVALSLKFFD